MNARQKAKKYKKEIEFYKRSLFVPNIKVYNTDVKRYRVKQTVSTDDLYRMSAEAEDIHTYIYRSIKMELAEKIVSDIYFKIEPSFIPYHTDITGEITIVKKEI